MSVLYYAILFTLILLNIRNTRVFFYTSMVLCVSIFYMFLGSFDSISYDLWYFSVIFMSFAQFLLIERFGISDRLPKLCVIFYALICTACTLYMYMFHEIGFYTIICYSCQKLSIM